MKYAIFDLDMTLFNTPSPDYAEFINNKNSLPLKENHINWWSEPDSLSPKINIGAHDLIIDYLNLYNKDDDWYTILITHRHKNLTANIIKLLKKFNLNFDKVIITFVDKDKILFDRVPDVINAEKIIVFEDSFYNIYKYRHAFIEKNIPHELKLVSLNKLITIEDFVISDIENFEMKFI